MELKKIIKELNSAVSDIRLVKNIDIKDELVLLSKCDKTIINSYTDYIYKLYAHSLTSKIDKELLSFKFTERTIESNKEKVLKDIEYKVIRTLFYWLTSDKFNNYLEGKYDTD